MGEADKEAQRQQRAGVRRTRREWERVRERVVGDAEKGRTREELDEMGLSSKEAVKSVGGEGRRIEFKVKNKARNGERTKWATRGSKGTNACKGEIE